MIAPGGVSIEQLVCCPPCGKEGKRSRVYPRSTQFEASPDAEHYHDESGVLHQHGTWRVTVYQCSNGHWWSLRRRDKCRHCAFGSENPQVLPHVHAVVEGSAKTYAQTVPDRLWRRGTCVCGATGEAPMPARGMYRGDASLTWTWTEAAPSSAGAAP